MPTKAELLEQLEAERWRTLGIALDRLENRLEQLEKKPAPALDLGEIRAELARQRESLENISRKLETSGISRIFRMLEQGGWRERLSLLSVPLAALFFGYCLAASAPPDQVLSGLLQTARLCAVPTVTTPPPESPDAH